MELPTCRSGSEIVFSPAMSDARSRKSEDIFSRLTACAFRVAWISTHLSILDVASDRFSLCARGSPVRFRNSGTTSIMKNRGNDSPVPVAPPPRLTCLILSEHFDTLHQSRERASLYVLKSIPNEDGTAACI